MAARRLFFIILLYCFSILSSCTDENPLIPPDPPDPPIMQYKISYTLKAEGSSMSSKLITVNVDGTDSVDVTKLEQGISSVGFHRWSPDGSKIAFQSSRARNGGADIWVGSSDGSSLKIVCDQYVMINDSIILVGSHNSLPSWSPGGDKIVYSSSGWDFETRIFTRNINIVDIASEKDTLLTLHTKFDHFPAWSPDGDLIAYNSGPPRLLASNEYELFTMKTDGSNKTQLTNLKADRIRPFWSADAKKMALECIINGINDIYVIDRNGDNLVNLTMGIGENTMPVWIPGSDKIVFVSDRDGNEEIYIIKTDGSGLQNLTGSYSIDSYPAVSPDGKKIAFISDRTDNYGFHIMSVDGTNTFRLLPSITRNGIDFQWSPVLF